LTRLAIALTLAISPFVSGIASANTGPVQTGLVAKADNAVTAATNPAGLTRIERPEWLGQLVAFYSESTFERTADESGLSDSTESTSTLVAPLIYYARPLGEKWSFGASVTAVGLGEDVGGEGPGRYLVDEWATAILSAAAATGYRVNDKLSLGAAARLNYTYYYFKSAIFNGPGNPDGSLEIESSDISFVPQLGLLYEFSDQTRVGVNWTGEDNPSLSDTPEVSGAPDVMPEEISIETTTPQSLAFGAWQEFENGWSLSLDIAWLEFSEFGISQIYVSNDEIVTLEQDFEDIWLGTFGVNYAVNDRWTAKAGILYSTQFIKDANRTQNLKLDRMFGVGVGTEYHWKDNRTVGLNLNYYDFGDAPVQTEIPGFGSFSGKYTQRYTLGLDFTFRWRRTK